MAKNTQLTNLLVNTQGDATAKLLNNGKIKIYDGVQPTTGDASSTNNLLCTLEFADMSFLPTVAGVMTANHIKPALIIFSGTANWFRAFKSDGTTAIMDGSVGMADANLIVPTTQFITGVTVSCSEFTHTIAKSMGLNNVS